MPLFAPLPRAAGVRELLDGPVPFRDLVRSLGDVARLNGVFGGRLVTLRHVRRFLARYPPDRPVTVLDVGTGSADIPRALVRWARRAGRSLRVIALDLDAATLAVARRATDGYGEITFVRADALALPFRPESVDLAISALTLHHLEPAAAAAYLAAMDAVARAGLVVNDLARSRTALILVWLATRVLACGRLSRHDGPLSVKRAYTPDEVRGLCARAGLRHVVIRRYAPLLRYCLVGGRGLAR
jgi:2-polyprenyl-3-methyl-5-hydroxy-6-metoxy-1,4-benzoquinol methylase